MESIAQISNPNLARARARARARNQATFFWYELYSRESFFEFVPQVIERWLLCTHDLGLPGLDLGLNLDSTRDLQSPEIDRDEEFRTRFLSNRNVKLSPTPLFPFRRLLYFTHTSGFTNILFQTSNHPGQTLTQSMQGLIGEGMKFGVVQPKCIKMADLHDLGFVPCTNQEFELRAL